MCGDEVKELSLQLTLDVILPGCLQDDLFEMVVDDETVEPDLSCEHGDSLLGLISSLHLNLH